MEALSMTAGIIVVLQLTSALTSYINDSKNATKDKALLAIEANNLYGLLTMLRFRVEEARSNDPWFNQVKLLGFKMARWTQSKTFLETIVSKLSSSKKRDRIKSALLWKFTKQEVETDANAQRGYHGTALQAASADGHGTVVKMLLDAGADVSAYGGRAGWYGSTPQAPDAEANDGRTPLSWAAGNGHEAVVKLPLTKDGIDPNSKDNLFHLTPLSWGKFEWLLYLNEAGFEVSDIIPLLLEAMDKSPWIAFEQPNANVSNVQASINFHQHSCAHKEKPIDVVNDPLSDPVAFHLKRDPRQRSVAAFCGFAGVFPPLKDQDDIGHATFQGMKVLLTSARKASWRIARTVIYFTDLEDTGSVKWGLNRRVTIYAFSA
ncbi:uncharacterized protein Z518_04961 [Rhinocladiella mackenziei CBS 650.93]|uniref:Uncharacterized protein n=1 Tax=Rhinocladiella mackenziei CBS 650.93 TaxID=1442369 RepID=A0A0D2JCY4_9EURO|nr:uncharacterized protein Z518_04961 [Rhinocladiella mackenziei CBS 650.93]KIX06985.1 hypothetical protein Z518_04961 [Rhinocladiella mackenziei CBS 650.93]